MTSSKPSYEGTLFIYEGDEISSSHSSPNPGLVSSSTTDCLHRPGEGILPHRKQSGSSLSESGWKERWCSLEDGRLYVYTNRTAAMVRPEEVRATIDMMAFQHLHTSASYGIGSIGPWELTLSGAPSSPVNAFRGKPQCGLPRSATSGCLNARYERSALPSLGYLHGEVDSFPQAGSPNGSVTAKVEKPHFSKEEAKNEKSKTWSRFSFKSKKLYKLVSGGANASAGLSTGTVPEQFHRAASPRSRDATSDFTSGYATSASGTTLSSSPTTPHSVLSSPNLGVASILTLRTSSAVALAQWAEALSHSLCMRQPSQTTSARSRPSLSSVPGLGPRTSSDLSDSRLDGSLSPIRTDRFLSRTNEVLASDSESLQKNSDLLIRRRQRKALNAWKDHDVSRRMSPVGETSAILRPSTSSGSSMLTLHSKLDSGGRASRRNSVGALLDRTSSVSSSCSTAASNDPCGLMRAGPPLVAKSALTAEGSSKTSRPGRRLSAVNLTGQGPELLFAQPWDKWHEKILQEQRAMVPNLPDNVTLKDRPPSPIFRVVRQCEPANMADESMTTSRHKRSGSLMRSISSLHISGWKEGGLGIALDLKSEAEKEVADWARPFDCKSPRQKVISRLQESQDEKRKSQDTGQVTLPGLRSPCSKESLSIDSRPHSPGLSVQVHRSIPKASSFLNLSKFSFSGYKERASDSSHSVVRKQKSKEFKQATSPTVLTSSQVLGEGADLSYKHIPLPNDGSGKSESKGLTASTSLPALDTICASAPAKRSGVGKNSILSGLATSVRSLTPSPKAAFKELETVEKVVEPSRQQSKEDSVKAHEVDSKPYVQRILPPEEMISTLDQIRRLHPHDADLARKGLFISSKGMRRGLMQSSSPEADQSPRSIAPIPTRRTSAHRPQTSPQPEVIPFGNLSNTVSTAGGGDLEPLDSCSSTALQHFRISEDFGTHLGQRLAPCNSVSGPRMSHSASSGDLYSLMQGKDCRFGNRRLNSSSLEPSLSQDLCAELSGPLRSLPAPPRLAKGKRAASSGRAAHDQSETEVVKEDPDFPVGQEFGRLTDSGTFAKSKDRMKEQSGPASLPSPKKRIASSGLMSSSLSSSALAASGIPATSSLSSFHRSRGHCHTQSLDQSEPRSSLSHSRSSSVNTINTTKTHFGLSPSTSLCSSLALTRPGPSNTQRRMSDAARKARSRSGSRSSVGYGFSKTLYPGPRDENFDPFPSHALVSRKEGSLVAETRALSAQNA